MTTPHILMIEDDVRLAAMVGEYLQKSGYEFAHAGEGALGLEAVQQHLPDLVILDLMLPDMDGLEVCRRLRALPGEAARLPLLMLTARGDPVDRIVGLEMGADDYLPKPFNPRELLARIQAMVRRQRLLGAHTGPRQTGGRIAFGAFTLWLDERRLERNGGEDGQGAQDVPLTTGEFALLQALAQQPHRPLGRDRLIALAYGPDHTATDRSIDVQVMRLRKLIEADPAQPRHIRTVWGVGYVFVPDGAAPGGGGKP